jgi:hypothetical protein
MMIHKPTLAVPGRAKARVPDNPTVAPFVVDLAQEQEISAMLRKERGSRIILPRGALVLALLAGAAGIAMASRQGDPAPAPPVILLSLSPSTGEALGHRDASIPIRTASMLSLPSLLSFSFEKLAPPAAEPLQPQTEQKPASDTLIAPPPNPAVWTQSGASFAAIGTGFRDSLRIIGATGEIVLSNLQAAGRAAMTNAKPALAAAPLVPAVKNEPAQAPAVITIQTQPPEITLSSEEIDKLRAFAENALATGDITTARLFLLKAVRAGNGSAMVALAETYDQKVLDERGVIGVTGDAAKARAYYEQAKAVGETSAVRALARLDGANQ